MPTCADVDAVVQRTLGGLTLTDLPLTDEDRQSGVMCGWLDVSGGDRRLTFGIKKGDGQAELDAIRSKTDAWSYEPPFHTADFTDGSRSGLYVIDDSSAATYAPGCSTTINLVMDGHWLSFIGQELTIAQAIEFLSEATLLLK